MNRGKVQLREQCTNLIEFQRVQQVIQLPVFAALLQLHVVLLKAVKSKLRLVVHKDLQGLQDN